ncbi:DUF397 domain-containing protein [Allosalinactinospora lopnorensis]|uniref:DUF397 domain-containing protein n=1 Tax=Allosalinactinospora lopnorensis TaxID=1352348 RepID=UPI001F19A2FD|nr:DUF397 domain-containing protein [Allosalinactinospora lopnorensis]
MKVAVVGWRTSSYSENGGGQCVEAGPVADAPRYAVRDSRHPGHGMFLFSAAEWTLFLGGVKSRLL